MGVPNGHVEGCQIRFSPRRRGYLLLCSLLALFIVELGSVHAVVGSGGEETSGMPSATGGHEPTKEPPTLHTLPLVPPGSAAKELESLKSGEELPVPHEAAEEVHAEHGPQMPQISPIPGVTFVETMINLMDYELHGRFFGWRPNDILIGQLTDNINYYQLGVLEALRFTTLRLKDSLTRMGDADIYDPDLEQSLNLFMNRATLFWFPSAETSYSEAVDHLKNFLVKLKTGKRNFYYRKDTLLSLLSSYKDLLGNVNKTLILSNPSMFKSDDYFYYAKGVAHVYYEVLRVVRVGFQTQLGTTLYGLDVADEIIHELYRVEEMDPWLITDGALDGFLANHRANINAPLSEAAHLMGIMSQF